MAASMKPWVVVIGLTCLLATGWTGIHRSGPERGSSGRIRTEVVRTPLGPIEVTEQAFDGAEGQSPWELDLLSRVDKGLWSRVSEGESPPGYEDLGRINAVLGRFGFALTPKGTDPRLINYDLRQHGAVLIPDVVPATRLVPNSLGDDFALFLRTRGQIALLQREGVRQGDWAGEYPPVFVGRDLVALQVQYPGGHVLPGTPIPWSVWREGRTLFRLPVKERGANPRVKRLAAWGDHWVLEVDGDLYIDGSPLAARIGATEVFDWRLVSGYPFYFAEINHRVMPAFGGYWLPGSYDQVVHYQCCDPALYNPWATHRSVGFWGRRGQRWYFVVVTPQVRRSA